MSVKRSRVQRVPLAGSWLARPGVSKWSFSVPFACEPMAADTESELRPWYLQTREAAGVPPIRFCDESPREASARLGSESLPTNWASRWEPDETTLERVRFELLEEARRRVFDPESSQDSSWRRYAGGELFLTDPRRLGREDEADAVADFRLAEFAALVEVGARAGFRVSRDAVVRTDGQPIGGTNDRRSDPRRLPGA